MNTPATRLDHPTGEDPSTGERFLFFWRKESLFSQWHPSIFAHRGETFLTAEQWMMAGKARLFGDDDVRAKILASRDPAQQKRLGRKVRNFDGARWEAHAFGIVYVGNWLKFARGTARHETLLATAPCTLVEASPVDRIWGIGLAAEHERAVHRAQWNGENRLGQVLTRLRDDFVRGSADASAEQFLAATGI
jgi:hypothetical protein